MSLLSFADAIYRVWLQMHGVGACVQGAFISVRSFAVRNESTRTIKKKKKKESYLDLPSITLGIYKVKSLAWKSR